MDTTTTPSFNVGGIASVTGTTTFSLASADFTSFLAGAANQVKWAVAAFDSVTSGPNDFVTTGSVFVDSTVKATQDPTNFNVTTTTLKTIVTGNRDTKVVTNLTGATAYIPQATAATQGFAPTLGATLGATTSAFYDITNLTTDASDFWSVTGGSSGITTLRTKLGTFTLNYANSSLVYNSLTVATNVPESDTYAMLLAGLGVMGFVARRRLAA